MPPLMDEHFAARRDSAPGVSDLDVRLALAVVFELSCDGRTRQEPIRVSAQNGVVILAGTVSSQEVRTAAAEAARAAVRASDFCNVIDVAADAHAVPPEDDFHHGVAAAVPAGRDHRTVRYALFALVVVSWLMQPWLVVAGVPLIPALIVVLAMTAAAVLAQLFRSPGSAPPPIR